MAGEVNTNFAEMSNDLCKFPHKLPTTQSSQKYQTKPNQTKKVQQNPPNTQINKQTNPTQTWMPNHLKNLFKEDMDLMTVWGSSLTVEKTLLVQLQHKINVGTETKISGLKLKIKIQAEE